jgi:hypothetical protein
MMTITSIRLLHPALALALLAGGCSFARVRTNAEDFHERVKAVVPGVTRGEELRAILGSDPNASLDLWGGTGWILVYAFGDSKTAAFNLLLFNVSKTNVGIDSAYFIVDSDGVVQEMFVSDYSKDLPWEWWAFGG